MPYHHMPSVCPAVHSHLGDGRSGPSGGGKIQTQMRADTHALTLDPHAVTLAGAAVQEREGTETLVSSHDPACKVMFSQNRPRLLLLL